MRRMFTWWSLPAGSPFFVLFPFRSEISCTFILGSRLCSIPMTRFHLTVWLKVDALMIPSVLGIWLVGFYK
ncbi:hypothetical protein BDP55DRAFT_671021 [Colletotrichum godetiae]|uniref:Uncharacterized protein n=1 Tax=Colletotrichum godetiae TaxID=1209918 RepID=A0AAJ0AGX7_9PEZI|nr:uncharacterized protein BDP55DRAFT_671021 [Colletotrichum godetiae]KAK1673070.1 hypothetical protein BDP55DRAFT_671021 [Colletotrichum godetiae]